MSGSPGIRRCRAGSLARAARLAVDRLESRTLLTSVASVAFDIDAPQHRLVVDFTGPVDPTTLSPGDLIVRRVGTDGRIAASSFTVAVNAAATRATFTYASQFADGDFTVKLLKDDVSDAAAEPLDADTAFSFFVLAGDATGPLGVRDRKSDNHDLALVIANFGASPATFSQGDFDGDGSVTYEDYDYAGGGWELAEPTDGVIALTARKLGTAGAYSGVELAWSQGSTVSSGFRVQRSADRGRTFTTIAANLPATAYTYVDSGVSLAGAGGYVYRVRSLEPDHPLTHVPTVSAYTEVELRYGETSRPPGELVAPDSLGVSSVGKNSLTLAWDDLSTDATGYEVWRSTDGVAFTPRATLDRTNLTTWTDTRLKATTTYTYRLRTLRTTASGVEASAFSNDAAGMTTGGAPSVIAGGLEMVGGSGTATVQHLLAEFDQTILSNVVGALSGANVGLHRLETGQQYVAGDFVVAGVDGDRVRLTITRGLNPDFGAGVHILPSGNYEITVDGGAVRNAAGETIADDGVPEGIAQTFFFQGDINHDRAIDFDELLAFAQHYGQTNVRYTDGDFTFDGNVDFDDLLFVARNYQSTWPAPLNGANALQASTGRLTDPAFAALHDATPSNAAYVEWTPPTAAAGVTYDGYKLWRSIDGVNFGEPIETLPLTTFSYVDRGLLEGERYTYRVRPYTSAGVMGMSTNKEAVVTTLRGPTNVTATFTSSTTLRVAWTDNSTNESRFVVAIVNEDGTIVKNVELAAGSTSVNIAGLDNTEDYTVRLSAETAAALGRYPDFVIAAAEDALGVTSPSPSRVELRWAAPDAGVGGELYHVERHTPRVDGPGVWKAIGTTAALTFADTTVEGSSEYHYRVLIGSDVHTRESPVYTASKPLIGLAAHARSASSVALTWGDVHGVNTRSFLKYDVQWRTPGGTWSVANQQRIDATAGRMRDGFIQTNLSTGVPLDYRVRTLIVQLNGYEQLGGWSTPKSAAPSASVPMAPHALVTNAVSGSVLNAYWTDADGAVDGFYVYVSQNGSDFVRAIEVPRDQGDNGRYFARIPGLEPDRAYYVRVRSYDANGESAPATAAEYSDTARDGGDPDEPTGDAADQDSKSWTDATQDQEGHYVIEGATFEDKLPGGQDADGDFAEGLWGGDEWDYNGIDMTSVAVRPGRFTATSLADALSNGIRIQIATFSDGNTTGLPNARIAFPQDRVQFLGSGAVLEVEDSPGAPFEVNEFDKDVWQLWNRSSQHVYRDGYVRIQVRYVPAPPPCGCENQSGQPVKYGNGEVVFDRTDLSSNVFGSAWGETRSWKNEAVLTGLYSSATGSTNGNGVTTSGLPRLTLDGIGGTMRLVKQGTSVREFREKLDFEGSGTKLQSKATDQWNVIREPIGWKYPLSSGPTEAPSALNDRFKWEPTAKEDDLRIRRIVWTDAARFTDAVAGLRLTDASGDQHDFYSFEDNVPEELRGTLRSWTDASGVVTEVTLGAVGTADETRPILVKRTHPDAPGTYESMEYAYHQAAAGPGSSGKAKSITLRNGRNDEGDANDFVRRVTYAYYGGSEANGTAGDLKYATTTNADGEQLDREYYRYWKQGEAGGYAGGLKSFFDGESYSRVVASIANPESATDAALQPFLTNYFEYDEASRRVTKEIAAKAGCSGTNNGQGEFTFQYEENPSPGGSLSTWTMKTTETLWAPRADGPKEIRINTVYSNAMGRRIAVKVQGLRTDSAAKDVLDAQHHSYDADGQLIRTVSAAAINLNGFSDSPYILGEASGPGGAPGIHDDRGLVTTYEYTPTGQLKTVWIQEGEFGERVRQLSRSYGSVTVGDQRHEYLSSETVYATESVSSAITTTYDTDFYTGTTAVRSVQAHLPVVGAAQNGPGTADASVDVHANTVHFDRLGRPIWTKDADGFVDFFEYDLATGAVAKHVDDVLLARLDTDEQATLPSGWTVPAAGVHAERTYEVDELGRPIRSTDPNENETFSFFDDARREVRIYSGWDRGGGQATLPVMVVREHRPTAYEVDPNRRRVFAETLTFVPGDFNVTGDGRPVGDDDVEPSNMWSLSRQISNDAGQLREVDEYFSLSGLEYSEAKARLTNASGVEAVKSNDSASGHLHRTLLGYNEQGQLSRVIDPTGTVTRHVFDQYNRLLSTWVGTDDAGATHWNPSNGGQNNMQKVQELWYDGAEPWANLGIPRFGNSLVTRVDEFTADGQARVTRLGYDWRDRLSVVRQGDVADVSGATFITSTGYPPPVQTAGFGTQPETDNVAVIAYEYDNLNRLTATSLYDGDNFRVFESLELQRVTYRTNNNGTTQYTGLYGPALKDEWLLDASKLRGREERALDDRGRAYETRAVDVDPTDGSTGASLTSSAWYDRRGNPIAVSGDGQATQKFSYDGAGRLVRQFVTDGSGGTGWAAAGSVIGDRVLEQTRLRRDAAGNVFATEHRQRFHDETGTGSLGTVSGGVKARAYYDVFGYDAANRLVASAQLGTFGGAVPTLNDLQTIPARSDNALVTTYGYDAGGRRNSVVDPEGVESRRTFDLLGRSTRTFDAYVGGAALGTSINQRVDYTYNGVGNVLTLSAVTAAAATSPASPDGTPTAFQTTQYAYGVTTDAGSSINSLPSAFHSNRVLSAVRYPKVAAPNLGTPDDAQKEIFAYDLQGQLTGYRDRNGTTHEYGYDIVGRQTLDAVTGFGTDVDDQVQRLATAYDSAGRASLFSSLDGSGNVVNEVLRQFNGFGQLTAEFQSHDGAVVTSGAGADRKVGYAYSEGANGVNHSRPTALVYPDGKTLSYAYGAAGSIEDRISRLSSIGEAAQGGGTTSIESYAYLGLGTVVSRYRPEADFGLTYVASVGEPAGTGGDRYAGLDRFGRVVDQRWLRDDGTHVDRFGYTYDRNSNRLTRSNGVNSAFNETYSYDALDRLTSFARGNGGGGRTQSWSLDALGNWSSVTTNGSSQTRQHNGQNAIVGTGFAYSGNGEMTSAQFDRGGTPVTQRYAYDAWGRLVGVDLNNNGQFADAGDRRFEIDALGRRVQETTGGMTTDLYYGDRWQVLEERTRSATAGEASAVPARRNVWSGGYVDELIAIDRDANGSSADGLESRVYVQQDANFNVTSLTDRQGGVVERYAYDAYGERTVLDANWDTDADGASDMAMVQGFQGARHDDGTRLVHQRNRDLHVVLGRWTRQDPAGYVDGPNAYAFTEANPINYVDPSGNDKLKAGKNIYRHLQSFYKSQNKGAITQIHHIITQSAFRKYKDFLAGLGLSPNERCNVIALPTDYGKKLGIGGKRSAHNGWSAAHRAYNAQVDQALDAIKEQYDAGTLNAEDAKAAITALQDGLRKGLKNGTVDLGGEVIPQGIHYLGGGMIMVVGAPNADGSIAIDEADLSSQLCALGEADSSWNDYIAFLTELSPAGDIQSIAESLPEIASAFEDILDAAMSAIDDATKSSRDRYKKYYPYPPELPKD